MILTEKKVFSRGRLIITALAFIFLIWKKFDTSSENHNTHNTIEYKAGEIFSELKNKTQSDHNHNLIEVLNIVDELKFSTNI